MKQVFIFILTGILVCMGGCDKHPWNHPHAKNDTSENIYYASFAEQPKTLDPARAYSSNEALFTAQIYEPPLQYHYLKRPYTLIPLTAVSVPEPRYLDKDGKSLPAGADSRDIAYSVYDIYIKPGIYYQPHPAFAKQNGKYLYSDLSARDLRGISALKDFKVTGTRELNAADYVYQIKRLADPKVRSPIFGLMSKYISGLDEYNKKLARVYQQQHQAFLDLRDYDFPGAEVIDKYHYRITLKGEYPQFTYWLAMPFFAPMPWEADRFYSQPGLKARNITLDWYPVGTGPYMLTENNPNRVMTLEKNPNFHGETYPTEGSPEDEKIGLLEDAGKPLPFIDKFIFALEKESLPRWTKFLQGYYDQSGISSDNFDSAVQIDAQGQALLTPAMQKKRILLSTQIEPAIFYMGFNMLDAVVGGDSERARKLRQALSIAINYEEYIAIFMNGRGIPAQGPIPLGIFGYVSGQAGVNPYVYTWRQDKPVRKSIDAAKALLREAGYPNGRDAKTGKPLILYLDTPSGTGPEEKAMLDWFRRQFAKVDIQLQIRATQYNRFQEKMRNGNAQIFMWGWMADYPDPENFLFLLYGANGKVKYGGENAANYSNPEFDRLFDAMKYLPNGPQRQRVINKMLDIARKDAPWIWGFYPQTFQLSHQWLRVNKPNVMANNTLKYMRLDPKLRAEKRKEWNRPVLWPIGLILLIFIGVLVPVTIKYWLKEYRQTARKES